MRQRKQMYAATSRKGPSDVVARRFEEELGEVVTAVQLLSFRAPSE